jgi:anti-sigma regulatory factor (Ser/Thr protein kinase)
MSQTVWSHETRLSPDPRSAANARTFVSDRLTDHHLADLIDDVRLAASELATNAVLHARQPFTVNLRGDEHLVVLTVRDGSLLAPVQCLTQLLDTHGRGLAIVESLSHDWGVDRSNGTAKSVWASF